MKKLFIVVFGVALIAAPFASMTEARGGGGRGRASRAIAGASGGRSGTNGKKDQLREREVTDYENGKSQICGNLRRRSR